MRYYGIDKKEDNKEKKTVLLGCTNCALLALFLHALALPFPAHLSLFLPASRTSLH